MAKPDEEENEKTPTSTKVPAKGKSTIEDDDVEDEDDSPSKKTKGKPGRKQGQKNKTNPPEVIDNETEQIDEIDTKKKTTTNRKGKGPASSKIEETPVNDELKLSEDDEPPMDEKSSKGATAKKGPTKRTAPASGKKIGATATKKKAGQIDEPFDDRTNDEVENNPEDVQQTKKGRSAISASKTTNRNGKKTKGT